MAEKPKLGSIVRVEFAVEDPKKLRKFYGDLFGWKFTDAPKMNYVLFDAPGGPGGGIGPVMKGHQPGITIYRYFTNIDETMKKIERAGGKIVARSRRSPGKGGWLGSRIPPGLGWRSSNKCRHRPSEPQTKAGLVRHSNAGPDRRQEGDSCRLADFTSSSRR